jgi:hypothetical protein
VRRAGILSSVTILLDSLILHASYLSTACGR